jgi:hypothetical protein
MMADGARKTYAEFLDWNSIVKRITS